MPKLTKLSTTKVNEIYRKFPNEFEATSAGDLRCNFCDALDQRSATCEPFGNFSWALGLFHFTQFL